jgi:aminobenzoyl-glutamate utilization protein B
MIHRGCFKGVDFALSWHPAQANLAFTQCLACSVINFKYKGISAHAAGNPHEGRSALDAAELTNVGCNYLREHMEDSSRIHYSYLNAGSKASNIVHPEAELEYNVRAKTLGEMNALVERVCNCAKGAALMTGTSVEIEIKSAYADFQTVKTMDDLLLDNLQAFLPVYDAADLAEAKRFQKGVGADNMPIALFPNVMQERILATSSTDMGDVSWVVPSTQACICCFVLGSSLHSWAATAQGKTSYAYKGMLSAAKSLAATAVQILEDPELQSKIKQEHKAALGSRVYKSPMFND